MARRRKARHKQPARPAEPPRVTDYTDEDGNVLTLRDELTAGTLRQLDELDARPASSGEDRWQRRVEYLFERLALRWEIAGLPLEGQKELLGATGWRRPTSAGGCGRRSRSTCGRATPRSTSREVPCAEAGNLRETARPTERTTRCRPSYS